MYYQQELLGVLYGLLLTGQQYYSTLSERKNDPPHTRASRLTHLFNGTIVVLVSAVLAIPLYTHSFLYFLTSFCTNGIAIWLVFNTGYSLAVTNWKTPFYLGDESKDDQILTRILGKSAGLKAVLLQALALAALNLIYKLLLND